MDNNKGKFEVIEMFMAQACRDRLFFATIKREIDSDGVPVVRGKIKVLDGYVCAQDSCQDDLGTRLDEFVKMVLDMGLHSDPGATQIISGTACFLN